MAATVAAAGGGSSLRSRTWQTDAPLPEPAGFLECSSSFAELLLLNPVLFCPAAFQFSSIDRT
jgi:hypothetical protein